MKGLGWPQQLQSGGASGLGWPMPSRHEVPDTAATGLTTPEESDVPWTGDNPTSPDVAVSSPTSALRGSALLGWDGAAPEVTNEGLSWPRPPGVSRESSPVATVVRQRNSHDAGPETEQPAAPGTGVSDVSRETRHDDGPGELVDVGPVGDAPSGDTHVSSTVGATVQTAPVQAEWQDQDRSRLMQQVSASAGVSTQDWGPQAPSYGYDDDQRTDLVQSLPRVDESTPLAFEVAEDARRRISLVGRPFPHPPHTRVLTVANQKGGVGKTTTTVNVAAAMAQSGLNVLVLDIDPQGNASTALGIDHHAEIPSLYDVVVEQRPLAQVLQSCPDIPNLLCAPATIDLAGAEIELVSLVAREVRLQKALRNYLEEREAQGLSRIDYVFIDCPPSLSLLTVNAFVAADEVFIPIQCEYYALEGLSQLLKHVELIRGHLNPSLHVSSILLTMYDGRTRLSSQVADEVREHFPETVLKTSVPRSVRISEAPSHAQTVMTYDPASSGALSYLEAARELAEQVLGWTTPTTQQEERA